MTSKASTVEAYLAELPIDRKTAIEKLRKVIKKNLPKGFKEEMSYGMIGYVVPHNLYPPGYHCNPALPLPFLNIASQKNFVAVYHMGLYNDKALFEWFTAEYAALNLGKLDIGKSCSRYKKMETIPYELIGELCTKISVKDWIERYEATWVKK